MRTTLLQYRHPFLFTEVLQVYKSHHQPPGFSLAQLARRLTTDRRCSEKDRIFSDPQELFHHGDVEEDSGAVVVPLGDGIGVGADVELVRRRWE